MISQKLPTPVSEARQVSTPGRDTTGIDGVRKLDVRKGEVVK